PKGEFMTNGEIYEMKRKGKEFMNQQGRPFVYGIGIFIFILFLMKATVTIPAGFVGVKDFFGKMYDNPLPAGFHIVNPLLRIHKMDVRTQEMSEETNVPSREGLNVKLDVTLLYSIDPNKAPEVLRTVGADYRRVVVIPQLRSVVRGATASYDAKALYTSEREVIAIDMNKQLLPLLETRGIRVEKVLLRSVTLPDILATAIEKKLEAEQQSEQMKFVLEKEQQEAQRKTIEAKGIADFQRIVAAGLTPNYLKWKGIETTGILAKSENAKVVVIGSGSDGLPLILGGDK
ncbi:MAG: prohibitin family protein, partial [Deltaproteobacteria bacterium]|nr:prohibitin family protein [Deltaproteobacteria bacterium]